MILYFNARINQNQHILAWYFINARVRHRQTVSRNSSMNMIFCLIFFQFFYFCKISNMRKTLNFIFLFFSLAPTLRVGWDFYRFSAPFFRKFVLSILYGIFHFIYFLFFAVKIYISKCELFSKCIFRVE